MTDVARLLRSRMVAGLAVALSLVGGGLAFAATRPSAPPNLPATTPQRLIAAMILASRRPPSVSGTVAAHVAIGLPALPDQGAGLGPAAGFGEFLGYANGDHEIRTWASRDGVRVAELIRPASELDFVANARSAWAWNSDRLTAYRLRLPQGSPTERAAGGPSELPLLTPDRLAQLTIRTLSRTSTVGLGAPTRVAGRPSYVLVVKPNASGSLVDRIELDVDAQTNVPLAVGVYARGGSSPALSLAYRDVSYASRPPGTFVFTPPAGARVVPVSARQVFSGRATYAGPAPFGDVRTVGTGWSTVAVLETPSSGALGKGPNGFAPSALLPISGPLFSARFVDRGTHGWLLFGAVPQSRLAAVAATLS
jgi:outer membrane lipoprotein-sorting protein